MSLINDYLAARGILPQTALDNGFEFDESPTHKLVSQRLNGDFSVNGKPLSAVASEILWIPVRDSDGAVEAWIARPLPTIDDGPRFLSPRGVFIPVCVFHAVWDVRKRIDAPLVITEGPPKGLALLQAGALPIALTGVWMGSQQRNGANQYNLVTALEIFAWTARRVYLAFDADQSSNALVLQASLRLAFLLHAEGAEVMQLTSWPLAEGKGVDDYLAAKAGNNPAKQREVLGELVTNAKPFFDTLRPALLSLVETELGNIALTPAQRSQLCKRLSGPLEVRAGALEESTWQVQAEEEPATGFKFEEEIDPWPEPVDGTELLEEIENLLRRFVVIDDHYFGPVALWIVMTYLYEAFNFLPYLRIRSPEKGCGKSTLLDALQVLVHRPLLVGNISAAALFRLIPKYHPTMLLDEAQSYVKQDADIRSIIDGGYQKDRPAIRVNPDTLEPEAFETFGPKALASIGHLVETIEDRGLQIEMTRKRSGVPVDQICDVPQGTFADIKRRLMRWTLDHREQLKPLPILRRPLFLDNRAWDKWRPLFTIAMLSGGPYPERVFNAARVFVGTDQDQGSIGIEILSRLRPFFRERWVQLPRDFKFLPTTDVLTHLNADEEAPWADWGTKDKPGLTTEKLSSRLKAFKIKSVQVKRGEQRHRGYWLKDFKAAFEAYLPPEPPSPDNPPSNGTDPNSDGNGPKSGPAPVESVPISGASSTPQTRVDPQKEAETGVFPAPGSEKGVQPVHTCVSASKSTEKCARVEKSNPCSAQVEKSNPSTEFASFSTTYDEVHRLKTFSGGTYEEKAGSGSLALDLETFADPKVSSGKQPKIKPSKDALDPRKGKIRLLSVASPQPDLSVVPHVYDLTKGAVPDGLKEAIINAAPLVLHNALFDLGFLLANRIEPSGDVFCTLTASRLLTNGTNASNDLGAILKRHLSVELPKDQGASDWGALFLTDAQLEYARNDVRYLLLLKTALEEELQRAGLERMFALESALIPVVARMESTGIAVDSVKLRTLLEATIKQAQELSARLRTGFGIADMNLDSPAQLLAAFAKVGVTLPDTAESTLAETAHPLAGLILQYRSQAKFGATVLSLMEAATAAGRIMSRFNPLGATSGRFSSSGPNLQNVPRGPLRQCFIASSPEHRLVIADYSQMELRAAAVIAHDHGMRSAFRAGLDLHVATAAAVLGKKAEEVTKGDRQLAKAVNFGFLYGQQAKGFCAYAKTVYGVELSFAEAINIREQFFATYTGLASWHQKAHQGTGTLTEGRTLMGRRILPDPNEKDEQRRWNRFQMAINYMVQGSCADTLKLAMVKLPPALPSSARLLLTIHDELVLECAAEDASIVADLTAQVMKEAFREVFGDAVPAEVETHICENWGEKS